MFCLAQACMEIYKWRRVICISELCELSLKQIIALILNNIPAGLYFVFEIFFLHLTTHLAYQRHSFITTQLIRSLRWWCNRVHRYDDVTEFTGMYTDNFNYLYTPHHKHNAFYAYKQVPQPHTFHNRCKRHCPIKHPEYLPYIYIYIYIYHVWRYV